MIVMHHFSVHGGFEFSADTITLNRLWVQFLQIGGKIGVNIFVLISGYFLISSEKVKTEKALKLWIQIFSYSIVIFIIFILTKTESFGIKSLIFNCIPISSARWWFASTCFVMYLLFPYINKMLCSFDKKLYQRFLLLLTFIWCIIPTFTTRNFESNNLLWFVYLYAISGYIRLYVDIIKIKAKVSLLIACLTLILTFISAIFFDILGLKYVAFANHSTYFYDMQKLPILIVSVFMFVGFLYIKIGYKRIINIISSATFGVYLIHDNNYIRPFLWKTLFVNASYQDSRLLIPYSLIVIAIVFSGCTIIELIRINLIEKNYIRLLQYIAKNIDKYKEKVYSLKLFERI
jgi:surface polysaccharide O-acyltransferase-like enzyme